MKDNKTYIINKKEFLELYGNSKKGKVDLLTLPPEILKKMCILLEEEIKIKERQLEKLKAQINVS